MEEAIQISKNFIKGEALKNGSELVELARLRKSIYHANYGIKPASVILNMSFSHVHRMIKNKNIFKTIVIKKLNK